MPTNHIRNLALGPRDGSLYVHGFHSALSVKGSRVVAVSEDCESAIPLERLGRIFLFGHCTLKAGSIEQLMNSGISLFHLTPAGRLVGSTTPVTPPRADIRRNQWVSEFDEARRLELAKSIVLNKIVNQRILILRYRRRSGTLGHTQEVDRLRELRKSLATARSLDELRGVEGAAARAYFAVLQRIVSSEWGFVGRRRRPAPDPVNALLSFGYSLLHAEMNAAVVATGLDGSVGCLHVTDGERASLALDLMEEFRPTIVDAMVLSALATHRLTKHDFLHTSNGLEPEVRLTSDGRRRFFQEYERRMTTTAIHRPSRRVVSYREALLLQVRHFAEVVSDPVLAYQPSGWS